MENNQGANGQTGAENKGAEQMTKAEKLSFQSEKLTEIRAKMLELAAKLPTLEPLTDEWHKCFNDMKAQGSLEDTEINSIKQQKIKAEQEQKETECKTQFDEFLTSLETLTVLNYTSAPAEQIEGVKAQYLAKKDEYLNKLLSLIGKAPKSSASSNGTTKDNEPIIVNWSVVESQFKGAKEKQAVTSYLKGIEAKMSDTEARTNAIKDNPDTLASERMPRGTVQTAVLKYLQATGQA